MSTTTRPPAGSRPARRRPAPTGRPRSSGPTRRPLLPGPFPRRAGPRRTARRAVGTGRPALAVLIPAYQPDERLVGLVEDLHRELAGCRVLIVDDGSDPACAPVLAAARERGAEVVSHPANAGKGEALRTGLERARRLWPGADVVCADADGQHTPSDIASVARRVRATGRMALGVREFTGSVPLRSRLGNDVTALLFRGATGWRLRDTQTGLRGYPAGGYDWMLEVAGSRYEYELSALLRARELGLEVEEVGIAAVYEPGNASSHFRPLRDSARIYAPLLRFTGAGLASSVIDWVGVMVLHLLTGSLLVGVVGARLVSGTANFFMNRRVFRAAPGTVGRTAVRYAALAVALVAASYAVLRVLTGIGVPLGAAKIIGDGALYVAGYLVQRRVVFRGSPEPAGESHETGGSDTRGRWRTRIHPAPPGPAPAREGPTARNGVPGGLFRPAPPGSREPVPTARPIGGTATRRARALRSPRRHITIR